MAARRFVVYVTRHEGPAGVPAELPVAADLADLWSAHALGCLLDACGVPREHRAELIESGVDAFECDVLPPPPIVDEVLPSERLDACRRAVVFAALSLEARLNRLLSGCDPEERQALSRLSPAETFRLAPRLLDELERAQEDAALCALVEEVFNTRDELVDASVGAEAARPDLSLFSPDRARAIVEASAKVCCFLATLSEDVPATTAAQVWRSAQALEQRGASFSASRSPSIPDWYWRWSDEFPPDVIGC
jgi:hypothetical protein